MTAPLDLVCKEAGVGRATLYRNFPDRHALLVALLEHAIDEMEKKADALGDASNGLFELLSFQAEIVSTRAALADYWRVVNPETPAILKARQRIQSIVKPHLDRAIKAGLCRADLTIEDVSLFISMLGAALRGRTRDEQARLGVRALNFLIEGLMPRPNKP